MRTKQEIKTLVFDRFGAAFSRLGPNGADVAREYARVLRRYDARTLTAAVDRLIETHRFPRWPTVAECKAAAERNRPPAGIARAVLPPDVDLGALMRGAVGARALREGWAASLAVFVQGEGRLPDGGEVDALTMAGRATSANTGIDAVKDIRLRAMLSALSERMRIREQDLQVRFGPASGSNSGSELQ